MPNLEKPADPREDFVENEAGIEQKKQEIAQALESGDYASVASLAQEAKGMETVRGEMVTEAHGEALEDDNAFDEAKAAEKAQKDAELGEQARLQTEADAAEAATLLAKLQGGNVDGRENSTELAIESSTAEQPVEDWPEAPKSEMFEKYGEKMRSVSGEAAGLARKMRENDKIVWNRDISFDERLKAEEANNSLNDKRNQLLDGAFFGSFINIHNLRQELGLRSQKNDETYQEYNDYISNASNEYNRTAMQDPVTVLNLAEAGGLRGDEGVGRIDEELRSNSEFMRKVLKVLGQNNALQSFWRYVTGEAREDKGLYLAAVQKDHLNYQWGNPEWKKDPEVQKIALESGLDSAYLQK